MGRLVISFEPTQRGVVQCNRTTSDGQPKGHIDYDPRGPEPLGLTIDELDEYRVARDLVLENLNERA